MPSRVIGGKTSGNFNPVREIFCVFICSVSRHIFSFRSELPSDANAAQTHRLSLFRGLRQQTFSIDVSADIHRAPGKSPRIVVVVVVCVSSLTHPTTVDLFFLRLLSFQCWSFPRVACSVHGIKLFTFASAKLKCASKKWSVSILLFCRARFLPLRFHVLLYSSTPPSINLSSKDHAINQVRRHVHFHAHVFVSAQRVARRLPPTLVGLHVRRADFLWFRGVEIVSGQALYNNVRGAL